MCYGLPKIRIGMPTFRRGATPWPNPGVFIPKKRLSEYYEENCNHRWIGSFPWDKYANSVVHCNEVPEPDERWPDSHSAGPVSLGGKRRRPEYPGIEGHLLDDWKDCDFCQQVGDPHDLLLPYQWYRHGDCK